MHHSFKYIFVFLGSLFLLLTVNKYLIDKDSSNPAATQKDHSSRIVDFWKYYNKASKLRAEKNYKKALENYKQASLIDSTHRNTLYYLGNMYMITGQYSNAEQIFQRLVDNHPSSARAYSSLGSIYSCLQNKNSLYNLNKAYTYFSKALDLNVEETGPLMNLAKIDIMKNDYTGAEQKILDVTASNFRNDEAFFLQGYLEWIEGNKKSSVEMYREANMLNDSSSDAHDNVGEGETRDGNAAMVIDSMNCRIFTDEIKELTSKTNGLTANQLYQQFEQMVKRY